jgi:FkbM family methyltransferase
MYLDDELYKGMGRPWETALHEMKWKNIPLDSLLDDYKKYWMAADDQRSRDILGFVMDSAWYWFDRGLFVHPEKVPFLRNELNQRSAGEWKDPGLQETQYYHHGLRFTDDRVRAYVREGDIIDAGAADGNSTRALFPYTDKRVISYELVPSEMKPLERVACSLGSRAVAVNAALANYTGWTTVQDGVQGAAQRGPGKAAVPVRTVDSEVARLNLTLRFIKADIEGDELVVLQGAERTLREQHPVLCVALYHGGELREVPRFVESIGGYRLRFHWEAVLSCHPLTELRLFRAGGAPPAAERVGE